MGALKPWHLLVGCGLCTAVVIGVIVLIVVLVKRR
jgi:hypothetical protein